MEDERPEPTCGQKCSHEMKELFCRPKARCFKGLAILCGIYTLCCGLMLMIIPPVVNNHGYDTSTSDGQRVEDNLKKMKISTIILLVIFAGLSIVNVLVCKVFEKREGRRESIVSGRLMENTDFHQNNDYSNDFEENDR